MVKPIKMNCKIPFLFILFALISFRSCLYGQQNQEQRKKHIGVYTLNPNVLHLNKVYMPIGTKKELLKKGWVLTEKKVGLEYQRTLVNDTLITSKQDSLINVVQKWRLENITPSTTEIGKIYLNPVYFTNHFDDKLNSIGYIVIPVNEKATFTHTYSRWSAITIPFSIRPAINGKLRSQVTSEFKIGTAFSLNHDWLIYRNRRMEMKKSTYGFSAGLGFGLGRVELNNDSTSLSNANYTSEEEGLIFFITPGVGLNVRGFKVLGFLGWDVGLTKNTNDWNYNQKPYLGVGIGFDFWTLKK